MAATPSSTAFAIRMDGLPFNPSSSEPTIAIAPTQNSREEATKPSTNLLSSPPPAKRVWHHVPKSLRRVSISSASPISAPMTRLSTSSMVCWVESAPSSMVTSPATAPPMPMKNVHRPSACMMVVSKRRGSPPLRKTPSVVPAMTVPQLTMVPSPIIKENPSLLYCAKLYCKAKKGKSQLLLRRQRSIPATAAVSAPYHLRGQGRTIHGSRHCGVWQKCR